MSVLKATWKNGQVVLDGHADWGEGSRLIIQEEFPLGVDFMSEDEQRDDAEVIEQ